MSVTDRLRDLSRLPLVVAPMAGGPSTPELVVAAAAGGALGFLAGGYKTAADMAAEIARVRAATQEAFGVNLFVPGHTTREPAALSAYVGPPRGGGGRPRCRDRRTPLGRRRL